MFGFVDWLIVCLVSFSVCGLIVICGYVCSVGLVCWYLSFDGFVCRGLLVGVLGV